MAIGDDALAGGMVLVLGTQLASTLDTEDNRSRDYVANGSAFWKPGVTVPVNKGGTGSTTAAGARTALDCQQTLGFTPVRQTNNDNQIGLRWITDHVWARIDGAVDKKLATDDDIVFLNGAKLDKTNPTVSGQLYVPDSFGASSGYVVGYIDGTNRLARGVSSERYKDAITPIEPLELGDIFPQLHTFVLKDDPGRMERIGYIAERLDENPAQRRFVVYEREVDYEDEFEEFDQISHEENEVGDLVEIRTVGTRVSGQRVVGSHLKRDEHGAPIPESIDFIALLLAQVAALHDEIQELKNARTL